MVDERRGGGQAADQIEQLKQMGYLNRVFTMVPGWEMLRDLGTEVRLAKKERLSDGWGTGGPGCGPCFLVLEGSLATKVPRAGKESLFYNIHRRGSLVYEARCLLGTPAHSLYLEALEPTVLKRIAHDELEAAAEANTEIYKLLLRSTNAKFLATCDQVREVRDLDAASRMYNLLATLATTADAADDGQWVSIGLRISQQLLADILGINRITAVKALGQLTDLGHIAKVDGVYAVRKSGLVDHYRGDTALPSE